MYKKSDLSKVEGEVADFLKWATGEIVSALTPAPNKDDPDTPAKIAARELEAEGLAVTALQQAINNLSFANIEQEGYFGPVSQVALDDCLSTYPASTIAGLAKALFIVHKAQTASFYPTGFFEALLQEK